MKLDSSFTNYVGLVPTKSNSLSLLWPCPLPFSIWIGVGDGERNLGQKKDLKRWGEKDRKGKRKFGWRGEVKEWSGVKTANTSTTSFLPPTTHHFKQYQTDRKRWEKKNQKTKTKTQKGHRMLCGLSVLGMTWILVPVQVRKSPITHNSLHKIPWQLPLQIFWSFPVSEKQYFKCNCCQSWKAASRLCQVRSGNPGISEWGVDGRVGGKCEWRELEIYKLLSQED